MRRRSLSLALFQLVLLGVCSAQLAFKANKPTSMHNLRQQHVIFLINVASALACLLACCVHVLAACLQAPITDCRPPLALQFHEWPTSPCPHHHHHHLHHHSNLALLSLLPACLHTHTHAPSPSASASALRIISTARSFPHRPCPALLQGFFSLSRALRCDHSLTFFFPNTPAATSSSPPAMRAACT